MRRYIKGNYYSISGSTKYQGDKPLNYAPKGSLMHKTLAAMEANFKKRLSDEWISAHKNASYWLLGIPERGEWSLRYSLNCIKGSSSEHENPRMVKTILAIVHQTSADILNHPDAQGKRPLDYAEKNSGLYHLAP